MTLPKYSQSEQTTPTTYPQADWQGLFFDSSDSGKLKRIDDAGNVVSIEDISGTVGLDEGGTGADLTSGQGVLVQATSGANVSALGGTGILKLTSDVPSVASLAAADLPTGTLKTDAAISGTLQSVEDANGNASGLKISTGDIEVNGLTIGRGAGGDLTNTAMGYDTLLSNTTGTLNTAMGYKTLYSNTSGDVHIAIGHNALYHNTTGRKNTAIGQAALYDNTTGSGNVAFGQQAGRYAGSGTDPNQTSSECIYLGYRTRAGADGRQRENVIGYDGIVGSGNNTTTIGEKPVFPDMPTSAAGLPAGALWNDSGTVKIV
jgi:hypothetical protein